MCLFIYKNTGIVFFVLYVLNKINADAFSLDSFAKNAELLSFQDSSLEIREALHRVLGVSHMMTRECVKMCVQSLLENLRRRPSDKNSIWKALQGIGLRHSWTVLPLVPQLLSMHGFFDTAETDPEDPIYVSVLILVFNAAKDCSTMLSLFEEKFIRHYRYLRDTLPHLVPELGLGQELSNLNDATVDSDDGGMSRIIRAPPPAAVFNGNVILRTLIDKLKGADNLNHTAKLSLSRLILRDVKVRTCFHSNSWTSVRVAHMKMFLCLNRGCQQLMNKSRGWLS